jgi:glycosyl hydrolase family 20
VSTYRLSFCTLLAALLLGAQTSPLPVRGLHVSAPKPDEVPLAARFIREALPKEGVNVLVMEINYRYQFTRRPEVADADALSKEDVKTLAAACREAKVRFIPMINLLGHQSWAKTTFGLLRAHPEFDETPGKYPNNESIYCRSYCPLHPAVHDVVFDLIDELSEAAEADAFHIGMDEVFLLGENDCARCKGKDKAELFAREVTAIHDHLAKSGRTMWMWGDRFLDGDVTGVGQWDASAIGTAPAIRQVPKDVVICDWHYRKALPTAAYFAIQGFPVVSSPWRNSAVALAQLEQIRLARKHATDKIASRMLGVLQTTWCSMGAFMKAYNGEAQANTSATEAAQCFRELFEDLRKSDLR